VIYEGNAQILSERLPDVVHLGAGPALTSAIFAEKSLDRAVHWKRLAGNVDADTLMASSSRVGSTYYFYGPRLQGDPFDQETHTDGVVWTKVHSASFPGNAGAWDDAGRR